MNKITSIIIISIILLAVFCSPLFIYLLSPLIYSWGIIKIPLDYNINLIYWSAALTYSTILLAVVAVFQDYIKSWIWRPQLTFYFDLTPPHSHLFKSSNVYYIRMKIGNEGQISAKNVEVFLKEVRRENGTNIGLSGDNLQWSSTKEVWINGRPVARPRYYWEYISPGTFQYCNLGDLPKAIIDTVTNAISFRLSVCWPTADNKYIIKAGIYECDLVISAANARPINRTIKFQVGNNWTDDEKEMNKMINLISTS